MSSQQQTPQDDVRECSNGCGFYGTAQTNYLCSKCFKDAQGATIASIEATPAPAPPANPPANPPSLSTTATGGPSALPALAREPSLDSATAATPSVIAGAVEEAKAVAEGAAVAAAAAAAAAVEEAPATAPAPVQKKRNRCATCNKKVGLTGIECRCELVFCGLHRYPEAHNCTFDFKTHDRENLKQTVMGGGEFAKIDRL